MRKSFMLLVTLICSLIVTTGQHVIIGGKETDRQLTWADFTGKPDPNSSYFAYTWWTLQYSYAGTEADGDSIRLTGFDARLQLDKEKTWVKKGRESDALLVHEQGHFNVGILCLRELVNTMRTKRFPKENLQASVRAVFAAILKKYNDMGRQYDGETQHGNNTEEQDKWNAYFKEHL